MNTKKPLSIFSTDVNDVDSKWRIKIREIMPTFNKLATKISFPFGTFSYHYITVLIKPAVEYQFLVLSHMLRMVIT